MYNLAKFIISTFETKQLASKLACILVESAESSYRMVTVAIVDAGSRLKYKLKQCAKLSK